MKRNPSQETLYTTTGNFNSNLKHAYRIFKDLPKGGSVSESVRHFIEENLKTDDKDD